MATIGISSDITLATESTRSQLLNFYKAITANQIKQYLPALVSANSSLTLSLDEGYVLYAADKYGIENDIFDVVITDKDNNQMTFEKSSFLLLNSTSLKSITITNTSVEVDANIYLVY